MNRILQNCRFYASKNSQITEGVYFYDPCGICTDHWTVFFLRRPWQCSNCKSAVISGYDNLFFKLVVRKNGAENFWFQPNGAPSHAVRVTIDFFQPFFPGRRKVEILTDLCVRLSPLPFKSNVYIFLTFTNIRFFFNIYCPILFQKLQSPLQAFFALHSAAYL